ncbi:MAG: 3-phosphoshikimate 1-carboxyvinyltransferase [Candidatus Altiarchaeales archaeon]|nr:MAG: 3-phosphoshikimate 1-carboxyvinyltransferase [Candidatus Altiarchaeales archaeon]
MNLIIEPTDRLNGTVKAPSSKSYTHRAIIIASLADGESRILNPLISGDTLASIDACKSSGSRIEFDKDRDELIIYGNSGSPRFSKKVIDVRNSGTTIRFMTSIASLCKEEITLTGDESILRRPMLPLLNALEQLGVRTKSNNGMPPISVRGPMRGGKCRILGGISSQFISSLLISLPLTGEGGEIYIEGTLRSRPYIDLTIETLRRFGARIKFLDDKFEIPGNQSYTGIRYGIEGDYSSAAFILAAGAITNSQIRIENLNRDSKQGDKRIVEILRRMGAKIKSGRDYVEIKGNLDLEGIEIDLSDNPDLVPVVAVLGSLASGKTIIRNIKHVRYKESDRISSISAELKKMNVKIMEGIDFLEIEGKERLKSAHLHGWNDHRIVMSLAVASLRAEDKVTIDSAESIDVSFPNFIETMRSLGCEMNLK